MTSAPTVAVSLLMVSRLIACPFSETRICPLAWVVVCGGGHGTGSLMRSITASAESVGLG